MENYSGPFFPMEMGVYKEPGALSFSMGKIPQPLFGMILNIEYILSINHI